MRGRGRVTWGLGSFNNCCHLQADDYKLGTCGIRWAFVLAVIALFDSLILGCLAFTLATKKLKFLEEPAYMNPSTICTRGRSTLATWGTTCPWRGPGSLVDSSL